MEGRQKVAMSGKSKKFIKILEKTVISLSIVWSVAMVLLIFVCVFAIIDCATYRPKIYEFGDEPGEVSKMLYNALQDIQYGRAEDKYGWCHELCI